MSTSIERPGRRVRHDRKYRLLEVRRVARLTPKMVRVTLAGAELAGFVSAAHDDHVKVFFPQPGEEKPALPISSPNGPVYPEGVARPPSRDYTPRRYDAAAGELDIDFILHGDGPASAWAASARPGQCLGVGGPRGSFVVADDFDFYLLIGDETALPAIGRRFEELPPSARALAVIEVADQSEEQRLDSAATIETLWLHRNGAAAGATDLLDRTVADLRLPSGDIYAWAAAESKTAKRLRSLLIDQHGLCKDWVKAASYWTRGTAAAGHETFKD
ncbi:MAG TPA: siderophore-interacting protein [Beijerinckiaceae bacterium]|nr:siderophore-interacting protein [Beijerinckiaceae bacterium]